jgi:hypothetical protein
LGLILPRGVKEICVARGLVTECEELLPADAAETADAVDASEDEPRDTSH